MARLIPALFIILACVLFAPAPAFSEMAMIGDVRVSRTNSAVRVYFNLKEAWSKEVEEAVKSGIQTSFSFVVELNKVNTAWFDDTLGTRLFKHTVKYDTLRDEYEVTLEETGEKPFRLKDFTEVKTLMTTASASFPPGPLSAGFEYEFRIRAELKTVEPPLPLVNYGKIDTGWFSYTFIF